MSTPDLRTLSIDQIPDAAREMLAEYFHTRQPEIDRIGDPVESAVSHLRNFVLGGGKRVRPLFAWAGFIGAGGLKNTAEDPAAVLRALSSLELIQACALIHDDIIDSSDTRRGNPTVHRAVEKLHRDGDWSGDASHFGESVAILAGDLALAWADDLIYDAGLSAGALERVRVPWRAMRTEVIGGQLLDISLEAAATEDVALAESVNRFKTAAYTIERPLHLGAAIAGAGEDIIEAFRGYGRDIGVAFQLRDDLLGVFGDPAITGKPAGDDLREGKRTVMLALALQRADATTPEAAAKLRQGIGRVSSPAEIADLAKVVEDTGVTEEIEERISTLTESGLAHLAAVDLPEEVSETLRTLAIRATARKM
ncbi:(2E,6E)-farnesyl diphosphate synthase [Corynebacterium occultum]|uniref:(2E,6E)-farnesyl diphosphate synthase n=1 Tax=Corynebacterium occultum TaxID=2675219 RepID=A0A6B8VXN5_9CORY|nr:polyprenyl synthetase family protein [Corynebacterium occultum]QGU07819.1 (2E,6E)-farnesyl diphosphate synthase [Corynebacterium occultum]